MTESAPARPRVPRWVTTTLAVVFGLFFAYDAWEAVGNILGISWLVSDTDTAISVFGWIVLSIGVLIPIAVFLLAFRLGRTRDLLAQVLLYLTGLGVSAVVALDIVALFGAGSLLT
ncbi:hypothetical protein [Mycetocola zhadangensis]|uniref:Uncharacterized protein n=1 Tax=Mycetocola zhadangensis TaxID=1164595 RepID=A0A3L7J5B8_9MICO|nr:hypothetical protein [Mycetocola zhadangensis]RLQ85793.1 hypothetical protein D9V28_02740 [Mycetocola zhadangensis]GGE85868.1 hypothetical protein GCM10011313_05390 [Mycetocola zhadangensis]